ncbi:MAG TPA: iron ABC transporter permease [Nocardiopsis listeri]|uniref:FecCD family ABC transporter permease n=1 Tax=Nocardiopsis listeri TaxID=53440 RepID=UPI001DAD5063|nr:iron ABC transporter permease [Nocardiopsis listeri]HJE60939.1 iron ABC transporter permease [Nocardiopsis listeri]
MSTQAPEQLTTAVRRRARLWTVGLLLLVGISAVLCVGVGPVSVPPQTTAAVAAERIGLIDDSGATRAQAFIVINIRLPRVVMGLAVGAALAMSGAVLQGMIRNVLADPYVLGISSGASTGAAAAILFGFGARMGQYSLPVSAFLGAMCASLLVFWLGHAGGQATSIRLLLGGIAVGYALSAVTSFLVFSSDDAEGSRTVMFWLLGSLSPARWDALLVAIVGVVAGAAVVLMLLSRPLDALAVGDETARALGVDPAATRLKLLTVVSLCTGAAVAGAGVIGFVGLVLPHLARRLVGTVHARMLPVTALLGSGLLIWADALSRVLMQPRELPIGIITALVGAPFLLLLIRRMYAKNT